MGGWVEFSKTYQKRGGGGGGGSDFSHKKGGVGKIEEVVLKSGYHLFTYFHFNPRQCHLYLSHCLCVCVSFAHLNDFYQYSLFHRKYLVLLNLIIRCVTSASE